jgi:predicted membrane-bound spermidine synthase
MKKSTHLILGSLQFAGAFFLIFANLVSPKLGILPRSVEITMAIVGVLLILTIPLYMRLKDRYDTQD